MSKKPLGKAPLIMSVFTSTSTLVCCALPALFVLLGAGAAFASLTTAIPQLIWIQEHKTVLFTLGAVLLAIAGYSELKTNKQCPADPILAKQCTTTKKWSKRLWILSLVMYAIGFSVAYIPPLLIR